MHLERASIGILDYACAAEAETPCPTCRRSSPRCAEGGHDEPGPCHARPGRRSPPRGRNLEKIGQHAQDTSELSFTDVRVPVANRLGEENSGFSALMRNLPRERLTIAVNATASALGALDRTLRRSGGPPSCSPRSSTGAYSCTAGTAT
jgi:hypothetical protein